MILLRLLAFPRLGGAVARRVSVTLARVRGTLACGSAVCYELAFSHLGPKQAFVLKLRQSEFN